MLYALNRVIFVNCLSINVEKERCEPVTEYEVQVNSEREAGIMKSLRNLHFIQQSDSMKDWV